MKNVCVVNVIILFSILQLIHQPALAAENTQDEDTADNFALFTRPIENTPIPVLMYHKIDDITPTEWWVSVDAFAEQMRFLKEYGYSPITPDELLDHLIDGVHMPPDPVFLTFDDGFENFYTQAYPVLLQYNFPALNSLITGYIGENENGRLMDTWERDEIEQQYPSYHLIWPEIIEMYNNGIYFASHTVTHEDLRAQPISDAWEEIFDSKEYLEYRLGDEVPLFTYPYGSYDDQIKSMVINAGYKGALAAWGGIEQSGSADRYAIRRVTINRDMNLGQFWTEINPYSEGQKITIVVDELLNKSQNMIYTLLTSDQQFVMATGDVEYQGEYFIKEMPEINYIYNVVNNESEMNELLAHGAFDASRESILYLERNTPYIDDISFNVNKYGTLYLNISVHNPYENELAIILNIYLSSGKNLSKEPIEILKVLDGGESATIAFDKDVARYRNKLYVRPVVKSEFDNEFKVTDTNEWYQFTDIGNYEFLTELNVSDDNENTISLFFGTSTLVDVGYDEGFDLYAPPPPPVGAFDARLVRSGEGYFRDIRPPVQKETNWKMSLRPSSSGSPIRIDWDPGTLPVKGSIYLKFIEDGDNQLIDMREETEVVITEEGDTEVTITHSIQIERLITVKPDWNLIGLPVEPDQKDYNELFMNSVDGTLYRFDGGYQETNELEAGVGYWLRFQDYEEIDMLGMELDEMILSLNTGWNLISGISEQVYVSNIDDPNDIIVPGTLFGFDGAYYLTDTLEPGSAYWIRTKRSGDIEISTASLHKPTKESIVHYNKYNYEFSEFIQLIIRNDQDIRFDLYLGVKNDGGTEKMNYSLPPLPPGDSFDVRFVDDSYVSYKHDEYINIQNNAYPLTIGINRGNNTLTENRITVEEIVEGNIVDEHSIVGDEVIIINRRDVEMLRIRTEEQVLEVVDNYSLSQNYPNPFNPRTTIEYGIPEETHVRLKVYDMLGQEVATLVDEQLSSGFHQVEFYSYNLPSGIYVYRLHTENYSRFKTMTIIK